MKNLISFALIILFLGIVNISCDDTIVGDENIPLENVSYAKHIQPIFNNHCNNSSCHNSEDRAGGISLQSYGEIFASPFLVIPYEPEESQIYQSVSGMSVNIMPPAYSTSLPLSDNQIRGIKTWIEEGAKAE